MLYYGKTLVDTINPTTKEAEKVLKLKQELINEYGQFPLFMEFVPEIKNRFKPDQKIFPIHALKTVEQIRTPQGSETWTWTDIPATSDEKGNLKFNNNIIDFQGLMRIEEYDFDKAVFLRFFSEKCADNSIKGNKVFRFINEESAARKDKEYDVKYAKVLTLLSSDDEREISLNDLRTIASVWSLSFDAMTSRTLLCKRIKNDILRKEKEKKGSGIDEFLKVVNVDENVILRGKINELFTQKILTEKGSGASKVVFFNKGEEKTELCKIPVSMDKKEYIFKYFQKNPSIKEDILNFMEESNK